MGIINPFPQRNAVRYIKINITIFEEEKTREKIHCYAKKRRRC